MFLQANDMGPPPASALRRSDSFSYPVPTPKTPLSSPSLLTPHVPTEPSIASSSPPVTINQPLQSMCTRFQNNIVCPKIHTDGTIPYPPPQATDVVTMLFAIEPTSFITAPKSPTWGQAMNDEFDALLRNGTWSLVPAQPSMNMMVSKWVFQFKQRADSNVEHQKAQLVAKGFTQQPDLNYNET